MAMSDDASDILGFHKNVTEQEKRAANNAAFSELFKQLKENDFEATETPLLGFPGIVIDDSGKKLQVLQDENCMIGIWIVGKHEKKVVTPKEVNKLTHKNGRLQARDGESGVRVLARAIVDELT